MTQRQVPMIRKVQRTFETPVYCDAATGQVVAEKLGKDAILRNFLAGRARVQDDPGRFPHIELDLERSFDGALSCQSVCEQTGGVLRHTESVRDDKVQEEDWKQSLEKKFSAPPARPTARSHSWPGGQSVRMTKSRRSGQSQTPEAMTQ